MMLPGWDVDGNQFDLQIAAGGAGAFNVCAGSAGSMFSGGGCGSRELLKRIFQDGFVGRFGRGSTGNDAQVCRWCPLSPHRRRSVNQCYQFIRHNGVL